jgi:uncharacterized protein Yka (UPF0111/DUF47 family)
MVKWLLPRENRFLVYLDSMAKNVAAAAEIYFEIRGAKSRDDFCRISEALRRKEHETDELAHLLFEELDKTFVTPIDREDLHALASALDEVMDYIDRCAAQIVLYKLEQLTPAMQEQVRITRDAAQVIAQCVALLQNIHKAEGIKLHIIHVNSLENEGDKVYRRALGQLFESKIDAIELFREKEILDAMEETIDACEDVMDLIRSVVAKNG